MPAKTIGQADQETSVFDIVIIIQLGVKVTIPSIQIPILGNGITKTRFPHRSLLRSQSAFCVQSEVLSKVSLHNGTKLGHIVHNTVRAVNPIGASCHSAIEIIVDAGPACKKGGVPSQAVHQVDFIFIAGRLEIASFGL